MDMRGKVALVTGGAVRIGRAIAEALADEGVAVAIHYRTSATEAEACRRDLERRGVRAFPVQADLRSERACRELVQAARAAAGRLDFLVNNAAVFNKDTLRTTDEARLLGEFWPNFFAPLFLTRAFAAACERGGVVNILDRRIASNDASCVPYVLAKKALAEFTRLAALELAPGLAVNGVAPGPVLPPPGEGEGYLAERGGKVPLGRRPTATDVARAVVDLLRAEAVTGQIVFVDGGQHLLGNGV